MINEIVCRASQQQTYHASLTNACISTFDSRYMFRFFIQKSIKFDYISLVFCFISVFKSDHTIAHCPDTDENMIHFLSESYVDFLYSISVDIIE